MEVTIRSTRFAAASRSSQTVPAVGRYAASFGLSFGLSLGLSLGLTLGLTSLFNAILVILKETNEATLLAWMKAATGHHWITHGLLDLALFVVLGFALAGVGARLGARPGVVIGTVVGGMLLGALMITGFYL